MRHLILTSFMSFIILGCGQKKKPVTGWNYNEPQTDAIYEVKIPDKRNKKARPEKIIFELNKREHFVSFGKFDLETVWKVYDESDSLLAKPLIDTNFKANQESLINISSLNTGQYRFNYTALYESRYFTLNIEKNLPPYYE